MLRSTKDRAESLELLTPRLEINQKCQDRDFQAWLQSRLDVRSGERVLDLACGNGAQSKYFDRRIGSNGYLLSVDIHQPSLESLKQVVIPGKNRQFAVSDMMDFSSYLEKCAHFTLAHCSFALPYASDPELVISKLANSLQKPLGRLAISLPCNPHDMVDFAKSIHPIPDAVEPAIELGEALCIGVFRRLFGEVDVSYFNSKLHISSEDDFMSLYRSTTYYSPDHDQEVLDAIRLRIRQNGGASFRKCAILIIGSDPL